MASIFKRKPKGNVSNRLSEYAGNKDTKAQQAQTVTGGRALVNERIDKAIRGKGFALNIQRNLARADLKLTVAEFIGLKILSTAAGFGVGVFLGREFKQFSLIVGLLVAILFMYIP